MQDVVLRAGVLGPRNVVQDLEDAAKSLTIDASTLAPSVINNAQSAINAALTAVPGVASRIGSATVALATPLIEDLEQRIPNNCSIGTRLVCVGYAHDISCSELPFNLSSLVSGATSGLPSTLASSIEGALHDKVNQLQPMVDKLSTLSVYLQQLLVLGGGLMVVLLISFICSTLVLLPDVASVVSRFGVPCRMVAVSSLGLVCCFPFILLTAFFAVIQARTRALPPWIEAQSGQVSRLCFGALGCAVVMALLTLAAPVITQEHRSITRQSSNQGVIKAAL